MAYFYGHIKALKSDNTVFKVDFESADTSSTPVGMNTPKILNGSTDCGNIITSNALNGHINNSFMFKSKVSFTDPSKTYPSSDTLDMTIGTEYANGSARPGSWIIFKPNFPFAGSNGSSSIQPTNNDSAIGGIRWLAGSTPGGGARITYQQKIGGTINNRLIISNGVNTVYGKQCSIQIRQSGAGFQQTIEETMDGNMEFTTARVVAVNTAVASFKTNPIYIGLVSGSSGYGLMFGTSSGTAIANTQAWFNVPVNATYFNATSDKRAKENIRKATFSALDVIQSLPIYNFDYSEDKTHSIGLIAQDAQDINLDDFEIVANKEASGENGNYMSVKESKLVYIAWKAIQEQQEVIKALKQEIEELKKNKKD